MSVKRITHSLLKQLLARVLQALSTVLNTPPFTEHLFDLPLDFVHALCQPVTSLNVIRHIGQMCAEVRLLAVSDGAVYEGEPVVELLWCLYGMLGLQRSDRLRAKKGRVAAGNDGCTGARHN